MSATSPASYIRRGSAAIDEFAKPVPVAASLKPMPKLTDYDRLMDSFARSEGALFWLKDAAKRAVDSPDDLEHFASELARYAAAHAAFLDRIISFVEEDAAEYETDIMDKIHDGLAPALHVRAAKMRADAEEYGPRVRSVADEHGVLNKRQQGI